MDEKMWRQKKTETDNVHFSMITNVLVQATAENPTDNFQWKCRETESKVRWRQQSQ